MLYEFPLMADLTKFDGPVASLFNELNANLATFGVHEKLSVLSEVGSVVVTIEQPLSKEKEEQMRSLIQSEFDKKPELGIRISPLRRKPGNVQQSVE